MLLSVRNLLKDRVWRARAGAYLRYLVANPRECVRSRPSLAHREPPYLASPLRSNAVFVPPQAPLQKWGTRPLMLPDSIHLAGTSLAVSEPEVIDWTRTFGDDEDTSALHRFAWLLPWVVEAGQQDADAGAVRSVLERMAASWVRAHGSPGQGAAWQPYTISERLINWIVASLACGGVPPQPESMLQQAAHLRAHLEYYGDGLTGNHLSNNGRALYMTGLVLGDTSLAAAGRTILLRERERLFDADGFLGEDSSHYQFLITRNYCEALWVARRSSDDEMVAALADTVNRLSQACFFFLVRAADRWRMPLFGDISPDCTPEWLLGVPWVGASLSGATVPSPPPTRPGWHSLFPVEPAATDAGSRRHGNRAWARLDAGDWTCFAHVNPEGTIGPTTHAHNDTGGIVINHRGDAVVMDAGRRHYCDDEAGRYGRGAWAHSAVIVDGTPPAPEWRWYFADRFLQSQAGMAPSLSVDDDRLSIAYGGGEATPRVGMRQRRVAREGDSLVVTDEINGSGDHEIAMVFHVPSGARLEGDVLVVPLSGRTARLRVASGLTTRRLYQGGRESDTLGWAATRYGAREAVSSLVASARVTLPWRETSVLTCAES